MLRSFAIHGLEFRGKLVKRGDLDGMGCLALMQQAGVDMRKTEYVEQGTYLPGALTADSGKQEGVVYKVAEDKPTLIVDHHGETSRPGSSATIYLYNLLVEMGVLRDTEYIYKMVDFITRSDNARLPDEDNYFANPNYHRTLLGLRNFVRRPYDLIKFFKDGHSETDILTDEELRKYGFIYPELDDNGNQILNAKGNSKIINRSSEVRYNIKLSQERIDVLEKRRFVAVSSKYGKIIIDYRDDNKKITGSFVAVKAAGYDGFIIWNPANQSFFVSATRPFDFDRSQIQDGIIQRETMWMKEKTDKTPLKLKLKDILDKET